MEHKDHVYLLEGGIPGPGGVWADFGSGTGAFTLALADLIDPGGVIHSIDRVAGALRQQEREMQRRFPAVEVHYITADYTRPLDLPPLDGVVMANALHFQRDKGPVLRRILGYLRPGGRYILVEYDADQGNPWVPYPLSFRTWRELAPREGFTEPQLLATVPSRFLGRIYSALSLRPEEGPGAVGDRPVAPTPSRRPERTRGTTMSYTRFRAIPGALRSERHEYVVPNGCEGPGLAGRGPSWR